jgi:hypothetical protein
MIISDFFVLRDSFLRHVRSKLKGVQYDLKMSTFEATKEKIFSSWENSKHFNDIGKHELFVTAINGLRKQYLDVKKSIDEWKNQIELTNKSGDSPKRKRKYIEEMNEHIERASFNYTPKFPSLDQNSFLRSSFDENLLFLGFKRPCTVDPTVKLTVIGDAVFAKLIEEKTNKFRTKDRVIYMEI